MRRRYNKTGQQANPKVAPGKIRNIASGNPLAFRPAPDVAAMLTRALIANPSVAYSKVVNKALRKHLVDCGHGRRDELAAVADAEALA